MSAKGAGSAAAEIAPGEWGIIDGEECLLRGFCGSAAAWSWIDTDEGCADQATIFVTKPRK